MLGFLAAKWLEIFIALVVLYVAFAQQRAMKSKESLIQDYKDIPELAKSLLSLKEEKYKEESEKKIKELNSEFETKAKMNTKFYLNTIDDLYRVLINLIFAYADYWYFEMVIKNMKTDLIRAKLVKELNEQKETFLKGENYPRSKLLREIALEKLYKDKKFTF